MAVTSGFFNSKNRDRVYYAEQMGSIFSGIIRDGILPFVNDESGPDALSVTPGTGLTINVGPGRAWFNDTWMDNNSTITFSFTPPSEGFDRIDAIVVEINKSSNIDASVSPIVEDRSNNITVVKGAVAARGSAVRPTLRRASSRQANEISQYALAYVTVHGGATAWATGDIYYAVPAETPYVTGPLQSISATNILQNWQAQFDAAVAEVHTRIDAELYSKLAELSEDIPVQFLYANDGDVLSCSKTFTELFDAYYDNRNGLVALYQPLPRTKPEKRMYSRTYSVVPAESGAAHPVDAFIFYFYDVDTDATFAIKYSESTGLEVMDSGSSALVATFSYNSGTSTATCDKTYEEIRRALNAGRPVCGVYQYRKTNRILITLRTYEPVSDGASITFDFPYEDYIYRFVCSRSASGTGTLLVDTVTYHRVPRNLNLRVLFTRNGDGTATCSHTYQEIISAIEAGAHIVLTAYLKQANTITARYNNGTMMSNGAGYNFDFPVQYHTGTVTHRFIYSSSALTYARIDDTPYEVYFSGGPSGDPDCDVSFLDIKNAEQRDGRLIIGYFQHDNGNLYQTMTFEHDGARTYYTFHFVAIVPTSGSSPSSWTYKCMSYRIMQDDTVIYSGN